MHVAVNVREEALALYDRIKSLIIRPLCVILHSLRHDLILVLGLATASMQSQHTLLPALPRWTPKSNRGPFGAIKLWLIGEKEPSGCLIIPIFISHPNHHINLSCWPIHTCNQGMFSLTFSHLYNSALLMKSTEKTMTRPERIRESLPYIFTLSS